MIGGITSAISHATMPGPSVLGNKGGMMGGSGGGTFTMATGAKTNNPMAT